jgi:molybdopterin-guanine dinucleotide biosynthesis protein A
MSSSPKRYPALVLAGRRGPEDPLAEAAGAKHRALLEVGGVPTLQRVVDTLLSSGRVSRVVVSIDVPELVEDLPGLGVLTKGAEGKLIRSAGSPSRSVLEGLEQFAPGEAVLVTAADHALLTHAMLEEFLSGAEASGADLSLAMVPETILRAAFPGSQRTYLPMRGERYSGANLFLFRTEASRRAAQFWTRAEAFRKRPWRLVSFFGLGSLVLFGLRRLDLAAAMQRVSGVIGARVHAVELSIAEAAIDVDSIPDWKLANEIVAAREGSAQSD